MIKKIQYHNEEDRAQVLSDNQGMILIEEQNITEGNFLLFSNEPLPIPEERIVVPKARLEELEQTVSMLLMGGM